VRSQSRTRSRTTWPTRRCHGGPRSSEQLDAERRARGATYLARVESSRLLLLPRRRRRRLSAKADGRCLRSPPPGLPGNARASSRTAAPGGSPSRPLRREPRPRLGCRACPRRRRPWRIGSASRTSRSAAAGATGHRVGQAVAKQRPVRERRQRIVQGLVAARLDELLQPALGLVTSVLGELLLRHVEEQAVEPDTVATRLAHTALRGQGGLEAPRRYSPAPTTWSGHMARSSTPMIGPASARRSCARSARAGPTATSTGSSTPTLDPLDRRAGLEHPPAEARRERAAAETRADGRDPPTRART
jgi:hypothetical protein